MSFQEPMKQGFTIYSKSGCPNCKRVKDMLKRVNIDFFLVDCDDYLLFEYEEFLSFIKNKIGKEYKSFPMVFYDENFVGGFLDTTHYLQNLNEHVNETSYDK
jgi:glutaredoxin